MARVATVAFVALLVGVVLLPVRSFLTKPREVIASTPSAFTGATVPIALADGAEACADEILFDTNAEVARFAATAPAGTVAPALEVVARGNPEGELRSAYVAEARVKGGWSGTRVLDVPLEPPRRATFGTFCVRNLGSGPIELVGNENDRAFSRPTLEIDGEASPDDLPLRFLAAEPASFAARGGQIMEHAATLRPLGAWWWWLLALAVVALAPVAVVLAMRSALSTDAVLRARAPAPVGAWPSERLRRRVDATPGWAIVAAAGTLAVLWFLYWGVNTHVFQFDEDQYVYLSRLLQDDFPAMLWDFDVYGRGLQRLEVWLLALPSFAFDSPASLVAGRFLNAVAFVSTAVPVYRLGRGLGMTPRWAALPAVLSAVVPWAVVTTAFLSENVAYPACLWAVWSIWRATAAPGWRRDLVALVALLVAGAARTGLLILVPVLPAAVLVTGLRCGAGSVLARVRTLLREHVLLWVAVTAAALPIVLAPLGVGAAATIRARLAGGYTTQVNLTAWELVEKFGSYFSRSVVGTGFLAAAVALPWLAHELWRPRDRRSFGFATTVVLSALALLYSLAPAGPDERYILYLAPLLLLPAALALSRREIMPAGLGIASVLLAALLLRVTWNPEQGPFGFFVTPVEMFYARVLGLRLAGYLPGDGSDALALVAVGLALAGLALAVLLRRRPEWLQGRPAACLVALVAAAILLQTHYALTKHVNGAGSKAGAGIGERAFVDRAVPAGVSAGAFLEGAGQSPEFFPIWQEVQFYNEQIDRVYALYENINPVPPGDDLVTGVAFDRTGRVVSPVPLPDYVAIPTPIGIARLRGEVVSAPTYVPVALIRLARPARLAWSADGFGANGLVPDGAPGEVRFYGAGLPPGEHCASYGLVAPPAAAARFRIVRGGKPVERGTLDPSETRNVVVALPRLAERRSIDVQIRGTGLQVAGIGMSQDC